MHAHAQRTPRQLSTHQPSQGHGIGRAALDLTPRSQAARALQRKATTSPASRDLRLLQQKADQRPNTTGLPDTLKAGVESLSGMSLDHVKVHYNSSQPAQLNALAYAQGSHIHVAPGQEQHLPHEAWHIVQQAQGRVQPTMQMKDGVPVNDDARLEREADVMAGQAQQATRSERVAESSMWPMSKFIQRRKDSAAHLPHLNESLWQRQRTTNATTTKETPLGFLSTRTQAPVDKSNAPFQLRKPQRTKRATTSTYLTQAQAVRLDAVAREFVNAMSAADQLAFKALPTIAARRNWLVLPAVPFRIGDVVEKVGQERLEERANEEGRRGSVITSVTLKYRNSLGTEILADLAELDALMLDSRGRVAEVVSAKLSPGRVAPAQDRALLGRFYAVDPSQLMPDESPDAFYLRIMAVIPGFKKSDLKRNGVVGFVVKYDGGSVPLETFRRLHPLAAGTAAATPVIGLTPKSDNVDQAQAAEARGDVQLGLNHDALLDALGDAMLRVM